MRKNLCTVPFYMNPYYRPYILANGPDLLKVGGRVGRVFGGR